MDWVTSADATAWAKRRCMKKAHPSLPALPPQTMHREGWIKWQSQLHCKKVCVWKFRIYQGSVLEAFIFCSPPRKSLGKCTILSGCFTGQLHLQTPSKSKILMILFFLIAWARATRHASRVAREVPLAESQLLYLVPFIFLKGYGLPLFLWFKDLFCLNYISPAKKRKDERLECGYFELSYLNWRWRRKAAWAGGGQQPWALRKLCQSPKGCFIY